MFIFRLLANHLALLTLLATTLAYFFPAPFLIFKPIFIWMFAATMFALGVVLEKQELHTTLRHPQRIGLGVLTQFVVMPLLAFVIVTLADLPPALAIGFIIVGCAPGAMASNVIVYLAGGAVAFSIAMTTVATFLSPLLTPSLVEWLGSTFIPIPFWNMMQTILLTVVLPLVLGMMLQRRLGRHIHLARQLAPGIAALAIIIICAYAMASAIDKSAAALSEYGLQVFALVVILNALGYVAGWYLGRLYGFDHRHRLTLAIEIGMQNAGMGVVLALAHFSTQPEAALPGALFAVWCIVTAAAVTGWLRRKQTATAPVTSSF